MSFPAQADILSDIKHEPRVLIIHSYHSQYSGTAEMNKGLLEHLMPVVKPDNIHIEKMDERRFSDDVTHRGNLIDFFEYKYKMRYPPDLVITTDDAALSFVLTQLAWLHDTPLVFLGVNTPQIHDFSIHNEMTGVLESHAISENLSLIGQVLPDVEKILVIAGKSFLPQSLANETRSILDNGLSPNIEIEIYDNYSFAEMFQRLAAMPQNSAVLVLAVHKDKEGDYFSYESFIPKMAQESPVPIFGMWSVAMLGKGPLGGFMNSSYEDGLQAGTMALRVLGGEKASDIPVSIGRFSPMFDYRQLRRFHIDGSLLPKGAKIHNQPVQYIDKYKTVIVVGAGITLLAAGIISVLLLNIKKRIRAEQRVKVMVNNMESTIETRTKELAQQNEKLRQLHVALEHQAKFDHLTGINNRRAYEEKAESYLSRLGGKPDDLAIALIDIDHFKGINDTYGHPVGDQILVALAQMLEKNIRPQDVVARWGGEEFILLFPSTPQREAYVVCERIRRAIESVGFGPVKQVTVSIGLCGNEANEPLNRFVNRVDKKLYRAKETGRNKVIAHVA